MNKFKKGDRVEFVSNFGPDTGSVGTVVNPNDDGFVVVKYDTWRGNGSYGPDSWASFAEDLKLIQEIKITEQLY